MTIAPISDREFVQFQRFILDAAGISMSSSKKALVSGRLSRRLQYLQLNSYGEYLRLLEDGEHRTEIQTAIDLLTTNETYFFREHKHFDLLRQLVSQAPRRAAPFRVWSAASSTGEEAYSIAMVLEDRRQGHPWEVLGSDISSRVLERARLGHYPMERARHIPADYLKRFCLKGKGIQEGTLLVDRELRRRVQFMPVNLNAPLPSLGMFDAIFLRNVMIYFNDATKREVVGRILGHLRPGGHFLIGHSETLNGVSDAVQALAPSIYQLALEPDAARAT